MFLRYLIRQCDWLGAQPETNREQTAPETSLDSPDIEPLGTLHASKAIIMAVEPADDLLRNPS